MASVEEAAPDPSGGAFVWAVRVKQGFKCKVYGTPECDPTAVRLCACRNLFLATSTG